MLFALKGLPKMSLSRVITSRNARSIFTWRNRKYDETSPLQQLREELDSDSPQRERCLHQMSKVTLRDLGLENMAPLTHQLCMSIVESEKFHLAAFLIPKRKQIPLHDHPNMNVYSKLVIGELKTRSFTRVHNDGKSGGPVVRLYEDAVRTPSAQPWFITEQEGNYHEFTALEDCVILDVLCPPYSYPSRPCTFYTMQEAPGHSRIAAAAGGSLVTSDDTKPRLIPEEQQLWELRAVSEDWVVQQYGLPVGAPYRGYVPLPGKPRR